MSPRLVSGGSLFRTAISHVRRAYSFRLLRVRRPRLRLAAWTLDLQHQRHPGGCVDDHEGIADDDTARSTVSMRRIAKVRWGVMVAAAVMAVRSVGAQAPAEDLRKPYSELSARPMW